MNIFIIFFTAKEKHLTHSKTGVSELPIKVFQLNDILLKKNMET